MTSGAGGFVATEERQITSGAEKVVLIVDDDAATRKLVRRWLEKNAMTCLEAAHGEEGIAVANAEVDRLDAIVLDVMMPGIDGYEVMRRIFKSPITKELPILLLTAHANTDDDVVQSMEIGALDHLSKPFSGPVLVAKVKAACTRRAKSRALVTELDLARENATIDALTGLANRRPFEQRLTEESAHARRHHRPFSLVMIDLDHFKLLNDSYGHETGDRALKHTARLIKAMLRTDDFAFRYGGEEFALLLRSCSANDAIKVTERLRTALKSYPLAVAGTEMRAITFSAGVASAEAGNDFRIDDLVSRADAALYRSKHAGRDRTSLEE